MQDLLVSATIAFIIVSKSCDDAKFPLFELPLLGKTASAFFLLMFSAIFSWNSLFSSKRSYTKEKSMVSAEASSCSEQRSEFSSTWLWIQAILTLPCRWCYLTFFWLVFVSYLSNEHALSDCLALAPIYHLLAIVKNYLFVHFKFKW